MIQLAFILALAGISDGPDPCPQQAPTFTVENITGNIDPGLGYEVPQTPHTSYPPVSAANRFCWDGCLSVPNAQGILIDAYATDVAPDGTVRACHCIRVSVTVGKYLW